MKQYQVQKGKQRFKPTHLALWKNKNNLEHKIKFDSSCRYDLKNENQKDINKLFGIGYLSFNYSPHHVDSARFGWRYNKYIDKIETFSYCYINKKRLFNENMPLYHCNIDEEYNFNLGISLNNYHFNIWKNDIILDGNTESIPFTHNKKWSFPLNAYFGGEENAPHNIIIYMEKK